MKKTIFLITLAIALLFIGCSKDDDGGSKCDSCTLAGEKLEICDNGDGTYDIKGGGETETITEEDLDGATPKAFIESICDFNIGF